MANTYTQDYQFKLNGTAFTDMIEFSMPNIGKELRDVTPIGSSFPIWESSKISIADEFTVKCYYNQGKVEQSCLLGHLLAAEAGGAVVSSSQFQMLAGSGSLSGSCLPMGYEWGDTKQGAQAPTIVYKFKKQAIASASIL